MNNSSTRDATVAVEKSKFERKREKILDGATAVINDRGLAGMTLAEVAQTVELNTTSITYYFRFKHDLAAAVFEHSLSRLEGMAIEAGHERDPQSRVAKFLELHIEMWARVLRKEDPGLALLSDIRALDDGARQSLEMHYQKIFRLIRDFFGKTDNEERKVILTARAHMLTEVIFWLPAWINRYSIGDFSRLKGKVLDVLVHGIAMPGTSWQPLHANPLDTPEIDQSVGQEAFLRAATRLINERGYRGASVDRIVAELQVTKGSFYHHLDAKDDLVLECFRRSYRRVSQAQRIAETARGTHWDRLSMVIAMLLDVQFRGNWPLLRTTALQAVPADVRRDIVERSNRMALRIAGTLVDGIAEGSVRPLDPMIASQVVMAAINTAYDLRHWAARLPREKAIEIYASTLASGLFD
ncbi:TetR/AcrR family transcriptional regulator [Sphingobium sp.]|uniref:TetR/AcrR family transcriptional regulator n=1 Tax=Sphingobium sp. TaxID=1912891 RepID=UPI0028BEF54D|nr:TetR/AcrR family transcriptional regulator [Sphingobium sp.]